MWFVGYYTRKSMSKETYLCGKRLMYVKRDLFMWKETYTYEDKDARMSYDKKLHLDWTCDLLVPLSKNIRTHKTLFMWEKTFWYEKRPVYLKRDVHLEGAQHICLLDVISWSHSARRSARTHTHTNTHTHTRRRMSKETYSYEKRPFCMKRELFIWRETYTRKAHSTSICSVRTSVSKETCLCKKKPVGMKRDLFTWKETYTWKAHNTSVF